MLCPSAAPATSARLLGIRRPDGRIGFVSPPLPVTDRFLERAGEEPDARFRFTAPCETAGCGQWTRFGCGVGRLAAFTGMRSRSHAIPQCEVRPTCRWFIQEGVTACWGCQEIVRANSRPDGPIQKGTRNGS